MPTNDKVHFEHGTGASNFARQNLVAFQRLWNRYNPTARISEDGLYGPATANAFNRAPCNGWTSAVLTSAEGVSVEEIEDESFNFTDLLEGVLEAAQEEIFDALQ